MIERKKEKYLYEDYTWLEMKEALKRQPVVILPIGSTEDHGHHLPLDTDNFLVWNVCLEAAKRASDDILLMPLIPYGFEDHHMEFPGTITISTDNLINFVLDITKSVAHHGFKKILIADGHGSNMPILDIVARKTVVETDALCAAFIYVTLAKDIVAKLRESTVPGGMSHGGEFETSVYLYLNKERVDFKLAKREIGFPKSEFYWHDIFNPPPIRMMNWWSRFSLTGVVGDPTLANAEKGKAFFEEAVSKVVSLAKEFREMEIRPRTDHHSTDVDPDKVWG